MSQDKDGLLPVMTAVDPELATNRPSGSRPAWFTLPEPVKRAFDKFPWKTYPSNELPHRSRNQHENHVLYVFKARTNEYEGAPSCNPICLKSQAYLKFSGVDFITVPSNNHASPSGALPFVLPASFKGCSVPPIISNKIPKWVDSLSKKSEESKNTRFDGYLALTDLSIRHAWLYNLYLDQGNYHSVARPLYVSSASSNPLVRVVLGYQLQNAARAEILKQSELLDKEQLYRVADQAFSALSTLLGEHEYFFERQAPGAFDASVFAYTYLIMDSGMGWKNTELRDQLQKYQNLISHQERLKHNYFAEGKE